MIIYDKIEQNSNEWLEIRKGKITGSILPKLLSPKTLSISSGEVAKTAIMKIISSKYVINDTEDSIVTYSMARGIDCEPRARQCYSRREMVEVKEVGFMESDCKGYGMSPDGLVGDSGFIEIKCVNQAKHLNALNTNGESLLIGDGYKLQILMGFAVNHNLQWCDLISYNEDFVDDMQMFIFRVYRNNDEVERVLCNLQILITEMNMIEKNIIENIKNTKNEILSIKNGIR